MTRIAIYARYSSDHQNKKSIDDQISECKKSVAQNFPDAKSPLIFTDRALSGQTTMHRDGYNEMLLVIKERNIDTLVTEGLDRLSRDLGDTAKFYKVCVFYGVKIFTLQDGYITPMHVGFKGTMNDMFIDNLRHTVLRSHRSRAEEGKMFGLAYGYKIKIENGREAQGQREINEEQAEVIREIFHMYAEGHSLGSIVQILNARNVLSPRKSKWTKQSLLGSKARREGILCNEIYRGRAIWNMKSKSINPDTGGKNYKMNPESEWKVTQQEHLRIISDELWAKCDIRKYAKKIVKKDGKKERIRKILSLIHI